MDSSKARAAAGIVFATLSVILGLWGHDGAMLALSCFAAAFSALSLLRCSDTVHRYSLIMSATVLACTVLMVTVASYDTLVSGNIMSDYWWIYISAAIQGAAAIPLIIMFFFTTAAVFKASYNWVLMPGIAWLVGMGMQVPKYLMVYVIQFRDLESGVISNTTLTLTMMLDLFIFAAFSLILRHTFKKNVYLVNENGLVRRQ